jgi:NifB/MoaA-like Fe-S oxidoreductase
LQVVPIENQFFGTQVTVTGLLSGTDLLQQLQGRDLGAAVLLPDVLLKEGGQLLLDDLTLDDLCERLQVPVLPVESTPWGVLDGLELLADGPVAVIRC